MSDKDIDYSEIPEFDEEFLRTVEMKITPEKKSIAIRLDADVLEWMKSQGKGYQSRINAVLRSYYEAHKKEHSKHTWNRLRI
ncbi:MAG: BrnA antitoxin family protein [Mycoplasmataceae bacterium]|nr:BrnA antitoxin family protein [Mycoplasmataceae bacterium]